MASSTQFCDTPFWNQTEFMTSSWPKFTQCFQDTVLVWAPCAIIVIFAPLYVISLRHRKSVQPLPITALNAGKLFCQTTMAILILISLLQRANRHREGIPTCAATYVADVIKLLTFAGLATLGQYERRRGVTASILQFAFWTFMSLSLIIPAYSLAMEQKYTEDFVGFVLFYIVFLLSLMCFFLNCWSEHPGTTVSKRGYNSLDSPLCPLLEASALSDVFFCWIFKLLRTGFKRDVVESDLWPLPTDITCDYNMPTFDQLWAKEVQQCKDNRKKKNIAYKVSYTSSSNGVDPGNNLVQLSTNSTESTRISGFSKNPRSQYSEFLDQTASHEELGKEPKPSLIWVLWEQFRFDIFQFTWTKLLSDLATICGPLLLSLLIYYMENHTPGTQWQGYGICLLMLMIGQCRICFFNFSMMRAFKTGMIMKSVLTTAIYNKAVRMNNEAKKKSTVGDIVNLMSVDAQRIQEFILKVSFSHTTPFQIIVSVLLIYTQIGPSVFVGFIVMVILMPLSGWIASKQSELLEINLQFKDTRLRMMNEILNGIKALKLYAWEQSFHDRVQKVREQEIGTLLQIAMLYVVTGVMWSLVGFLITLAIFVTFTLSDRTNYLDPGKAFMTLSFISILRMPMDLLSSMISLAAQAYVSAKRINGFLLYEEIEEGTVLTLSDTEFAVSFKGADLSWDTTSPATLKNINLQIPDGKLVAVVGPVGAGKSSLISAILGDMEKTSGTVAIKGSLAYVPQQAWIQNATVKDNILFGKTLREKKYKMVVSACELERDLTILTAGDQTEIGEKGINLSGGQKQRVSVARAVYQDCDLYLLDDPLSAVDAHVGRAMFDQVFGPRGMLKSKTRILVTHAVHFLPQVDLIVVMDQGRISELGTYEELLDHDGAFAEFLKMHLTQEQLDGCQDEDPEIAAIKDRMWGRIEMLTSDAATSGDEATTGRRRRHYSLTVSRREDKDIKKELLAKEEGRLIGTESVAKGQVPGSVYLKYLKAGGLYHLAVAMLMFWSFQATSVGSNFWLTNWTEDDYLANRTNSIDSLAAVSNNYLVTYGILGIVQFFLLIGFYYLYWTRMVMAGKNLHSEMTSRIFKAPMSFFDTTPIGRIINRCSRDIEIVDNFLPIICRDFMNTFGVNIMTIIVIMIETPVFGAVLIPVILLFYFVLRFYIPTSRQLRRIELVTKSPIYSHFSESVSGVSVIRAYRQMDRFIAESKKRVDYNTVFFYGAVGALRWLSTNLDTLANVVVFSSGIFQVMADSSSGQAGLTVSYALQITGSLPWMVRCVADFETNIVSVERIKEYTEVDQEADWVIPTRRPQPNWPSKGIVEFNNFSVRYRDGLDPVIKKMNITIEGGQKVGIVGRTGAGKSSLSLSLFRLMEASGGSIIVDGVNIADIGLHDLRSRLTILPQDPVLFSGSLRLNLDPFNEFNDDDIWMALERAHLKQFVNQMPGKLLYECGEEGQTLSVGQRQLLCLARTLLRKTKILILDEATAAVDMQTDNLIQNTIRFAFQHCTIIAIAHRLNTIMDYDKVMVLDAGIVKEYDVPARLLEDKNSIFYSMAADANLV